MNSVNTNAFGAWLVVNSPEYGAVGQRQKAGKNTYTNWSHKTMSTSSLPPHADDPAELAACVELLESLPDRQQVVLDKLAGTGARLQRILWAYPWK